MGGGAGRRGDTQRPLPLHPEGKLRPRKRIGLTRISQRRNKTRTQGVPFPRVPALVELPRPGNFPISRLNSSLGVTRSIGLKQGPRRSWLFPVNAGHRHPDLSPLLTPQQLPGWGGGPRSSPTWPSPSADLSHPEAVAAGIIISILQKMKLRLREGGRLAQGCREGRAWKYWEWELEKEATSCSASPR